MGWGIIGKAFHTATHAVSSATSSVVNATSSVVDDTASTIAHDTTSFSDEVAEQGENFAGGVVDWGKSAYGTVKTLATHPLESAEAFGNLATNPVLDPLGGLVKDTIEGKNPIQGYKDGLSQLGTLGKAIGSDYSDEYKKNGAAGVAGYVVPDLLLALATDGSGDAAEATGKVATKAVAEDVGKTGAEDAAKGGLRSTVESGVNKAGELGSAQLKKYTDSTLVNGAKGLFSTGSESTGKHAAAATAEASAHEAKHAAEEDSLPTKLAKGAVPSKSNVSAHNTNSNQSAHHSLIGGLAHSFAHLF
jgi:hypothetical protein